MGIGLHQPSLKNFFRVFFSECEMLTSCTQYGFPLVQINAKEFSDIHSMWNRGGFFPALKLLHLQCTAK
jgi:hypothetical protein